MPVAEIVLVDRDGQEWVASTPVEAANLKARGYKPKRQPAPKPQAARPEPKPEGDK
jgi:hypothetical protein